MDGVGGRAGWAWIFILEGIATTLVGIACWWMVFDWPDTARFLTPDERIRVQRRLILDRQGYSAQDNDKRHMYEAIKDWKTYGYMVIYSECPPPSLVLLFYIPDAVVVRVSLLWDRQTSFPHP